MTLKELLRKQDELDRIILDNHNLRNMGTVELLGHKITALMVETSEMANEVRAFKYWSNKKPNVKEAKEEYIDCLHFMLSIGNILFNEAEEIEEFYDKKYQINLKRQEEGY